MSRNWIGLRNSAVLVGDVAAASWLLQCGPAATEVDSGIDEAGQLRVLDVAARVFFHFFRERAVQWELLGVNVVGFVFNAVGSNLRHSHLWLSYGRRLEHVFISPAQHQIHHSTKPEHYDSNYGTWLALWDWLGGSLYVTTSEREPVRFGLEGEDLNHDPHGLVSSIFEPMATAPGRLLPARKADAPAMDR